MPNVITQEKINTIANCFAMTGFSNKSLALKNAGYSDSYSKCNGLKLYDKDRVKTAIAKLQADLAVKTGFSIADAQRMYEEDRAFAKSINQSGSCVSATTGICRLYGMDKDAGAGERTVIVISPKPAKPVDSEVIDNDKA